MERLVVFIWYFLSMLLILNWKISGLLNILIGSKYLLLISFFIDLYMMFRLLNVLFVVFVKGVLIELMIELIKVNM